MAIVLDAVSVESLDGVEPRGQRELAASLHFPRVGVADVDNLERHVSHELTVESVLDHARGELVTLDLAHEGRGVGTNRHRDGGVVDGDGRKRTNVIGISQRLANGDLVKARYGNWINNK